MLHSFNGSDGCDPDAGLIFDAAGNLYGTTYYGGASGVRHGFQADAESGRKLDGERAALVQRQPTERIPIAGLIFDAAGNLYGTTEWWRRFWLRHGFQADAELGRKLDGERAALVQRQRRRRIPWPASSSMRPEISTARPTGRHFVAARHGFQADAESGRKLDGERAASLHRQRRSHPYAGLIFDAAGNLYGTT